MSLGSGASRPSGPRRSAGPVDRRARSTRHGPRRHPISVPDGGTVPQPREIAITIEADVPPRRPPRIAVLLNASAGGPTGADRCAEVEAAFRAHGVEVDILATSGERIARTVRRLLRTGVDVVVAGGGDGTINAVAHELVGTRTSLGILPLGTLNHFAKDAGLPMGLEASVAVICRAGEPACLDVGRVNGHTFLNNASLGLYPDQVRLRHKLKRRLGKAAAAFVAGLAALRRLRSVRLRVELPDEELVRRCPMAMVGNNVYGIEEGVPTVRGRLDAGLLGLHLYSESRRWGLVLGALRVWLGLPGAVKGLESRSAAALTIHVRRRRVHVAIDGEPHRLRSPLRFESCPGALRVLLAPEATA